jgi:hypothetical protein
MSVAMPTAIPAMTTGLFEVEAESEAEAEVDGGSVVGDDVEAGLDADAVSGIVYYRIMKRSMGRGVWNGSKRKYSQ